MIDHYGYFAIIAPKLRQWQGFYILDTPAFQRNADVIVERAEEKIATLGDAYEGSGSTLDERLYGALQAGIAESYFSFNMTALGSVALALAKRYGHRFFAIVADRKFEGIKTDMIVFDRFTIATPLERVRQEIKKLPVVSMIEFDRLLNGDERSDGSHRRVIQEWLDKA